MMKYKCTECDSYDCQHQAELKKKAKEEALKSNETYKQEE